MIPLAPVTVALATPAPAPIATPSPYAAPTPVPDSIVLGWARDWLRYMQTGNIVDRSHLSDGMDAYLTPDTVRSLQGQLDALGEPIAVTLIRKIPANGLTQYQYRLRFDNGLWIESLTLDGDNKIADLRFAPAQ